MRIISNYTTINLQALTGLAGWRLLNDACETHTTAIIALKTSVVTSTTRSINSPQPCSVLWQSLWQSMLSGYRTSSTLHQMMQPNPHECTILLYDYSKTIYAVVNTTKYHLHTNLFYPDTCMWCMHAHNHAKTQKWNSFKY